MNEQPLIIEDLESTFDNVAHELIATVADNQKNHDDLLEAFYGLRLCIQELAIKKFPEYEFQNF
jgi:hypothetical protein